MQQQWEDLHRQISTCTLCGLCEGRTHAVPGEGSPQAKLMFIGEGPGADEDAQGRPFVGAAGQLLNKMIAAMGLKREDVYIANVVKCRPPKNREPLPEEIAACLPYLRTQVKWVQPKVIVCLGRTASQAVISPDVRITRDHGVVTRRKGFVMIPTFHPAALLRDPDKKRATWVELQRAMACLQEEAQTDEKDGQ